MRFFKALAAGLLVVCLLTAGLLLFVSLESRRFQRRHADYVRDFLYELSLTWDPAAVADQLTADLRDRLASPAGRHAFRVLRDLGPLETVHALELNHYRFSFKEESGVFRCRARFRHADALVTFTLRADDQGIRVHGLAIRPMGDLRPGEGISV